MKRNCAIISGGRFSELTGIETADFIIACDKGVEYAARGGIRPDLLVGDFDSYHGALPEGVPVLDLPVEKDDTDTMAAVRWAVGQGYDEFTIYCALGGRLDHLLGNIQTAVFAVEHGARVHIADSANDLFLFSNGSLALPPRSGWSLSVLAMTDVCDEVSIRGAKYPLSHVQVTNSFPIGISNEWQGNVEITVGHGVLMVISSKM